VAGDAAFKAGGVIAECECVIYESSYKIDNPFKNLDCHLQPKLSSFSSFDQLRPDFSCN